jgi:hypothetical protein
MSNEMKNLSRDTIFLFSRDEHNLDRGPLEQ